MMFTDNVVYTWQRCQLEDANWSCGQGKELYSYELSYDDGWNFFAEFYHDNKLDTVKVSFPWYYCPEDIPSRKALIKQAKDLYKARKILCSETAIID